MSSESDRDTTRTTVQTYVPAYQREQWDAHAEELGMSRSEFVRTMVQAGRRGFGAETGEQAEETGDEQEFKTQIEAVLADRQPVSWEELLEAVVGDIEAELETALEGLQAADRVRYSGPRGGYVLEDE